MFSKYLITICYFSWFSLSVKVVTSEKPGMGKSLHIKKLADTLKTNESYCVVPVHGPKVDVDTIVELLKPYTPSYQNPIFQIIHIDIDSEVSAIVCTLMHVPTATSCECCLLF